MKAIPVSHPFCHYHWIDLTVPDAKFPATGHFHGPNSFLPTTSKDVYFAGLGNIGRLIAGMRVKEGITSIIYNLYFHMPDQVLYETFTHNFRSPVRILRDRLLYHSTEHAIRWTSARDIFPRADLGEYCKFPIAQLVC